MELTECGTLFRAFRVKLTPDDLKLAVWKRWASIDTLTAGASILQGTSSVDFMHPDK